MLKLTSGSFVGVTVNGASQTGTSLSITAPAGGATINQGDIFTIAGV